jgi:hypothetical protein
MNNETQNGMFVLFHIRGFVFFFLLERHAACHSPDSLFTVRLGESPVWLRHPKPIGDCIPIAITFLALVSFAFPNNTRSAVLMSSDLLQIHFSIASLSYLYYLYLWEKPKGC